MMNVTTTPDDRISMHDVAAPAAARSLRRARRAGAAALARMRAHADSTLAQPAGAAASARIATMQHARAS